MPAAQSQQHDRDLAAPSYQFKDNRPEAIQQRQLQAVIASHSQNDQHLQLKAQGAPVQTKNSSQDKHSLTGLPTHLKSGLENLSGYQMDDVRVHYNSSKPAQLQAEAFAQGTNIHLAPGQEKHLPHEAWHVVQQKQGRVQATRQINGGIEVNDSPSLEREADHMGSKAFQFKEAPSSTLSVQQLSSSLIQRKAKGIVQFPAGKGGGTTRKKGFSTSDISRRAQHTAGVVKANKLRFGYKSGDGDHAEDLAIAKITDMAQNDELGKKGNVTVTIYLSKSPCTSKIGTHISTTSNTSGCTQKLMKLHNKTINGYKIHLKLKVFRLYQPSKAGAGVKDASRNALKVMIKKGIDVSGIDSDDSAFEGDLSDSSDAEEWREKQRDIMKKP